jgi:hypothetical protein
MTELLSKPQAAMLIKDHVGAGSFDFIIT